MYEIYVEILQTKQDPPEPLEVVYFQRVVGNGGLSMSWDMPTIASKISPQRRIYQEHNNL